MIQKKQNLTRKWSSLLSKTNGGRESITIKMLLLLKIIIIISENFNTMVEHLYIGCIGFDYTKYKIKNS